MDASISVVPLLSMTLVAYLIGSLSFAVIVSRLFRMNDPRSYGSGNPGATNVLRSGKKIAAALTLLGDALKGTVAVCLALYLKKQGLINDVGVALAAVFVLVGHMWPLFFRFRGGKGVATALGVFIVLSWQVTLISVLIWLSIAFLLKISSLAALVATIISPIAAFVFIDSLPIIVAIFVIALLVLLRHHRNIRNLIAGTEDKIGKP